MAASAPGRSPLLEPPLHMNTVSTSRQVTIVMYHYVRDLERSRFPTIKGLSVERFRRQLDHVQECFTPISIEMLRAALCGEQDLPPNPILLTFDDGYTDHFANVFPLLDARGIRGCFFPPAQAIIEHKVWTSIRSSSF